MSRFGQSSQYVWSPGMQSGFIDHLLVKPHTSWAGTRGVRVAFGQDADDDEDSDLFGADMFDSYGADEIEDELDDLDDELDEDLYGVDYGRLYRGAEYHELEQAGVGDIGSLIGRSGHSGYRGGRPTFGARLDIPGLGSYEGSEFGTFVMGMSALLVGAKAFRLL